MKVGSLRDHDCRLLLAYCLLGMKNNSGYRPCWLAVLGKLKSGSSNLICHRSPVPQHARRPRRSRQGPLINQCVFDGILSLDQETEAQKKSDVLHSRLRMGKGGQHKLRILRIVASHRLGGYESPVTAFSNFSPVVSGSSPLLRQT